MVDFRPFRGLRYDASVAGPMDALVCPPYDVISPAQEEALRVRSPHNMVRLELAEVQGEPSPARYHGAASVLRNWLAAGVLRRDTAPAYYLLRQAFTHDGAARERFAFLGALRLEPLGEHVMPHEHTAPGPKQDRLALMHACQANFSPLMLLYRDRAGAIAAVRHRTIARAPEAAFAVDGESFTLWRLTDAAGLATVHDALMAGHAYIADGHHRYETSLTYRDAVPPEQGGAAGFVMAGFIDLADPGLVIMPYHRVVHGLSPMAFSALRDRIQQVFFTQPVAVSLSSPAPLEALVAQQGAHGPALGLVGPHGEGPYLLTPGAATLVDRYAREAPAAAVREVEAWLLQEVLLRPVLGDGFADHVTYTHDGAAALAQVRAGEGQLAFFLKGVPPAVFETVVGKGVRLPRKSTYFYPKLPSGLVINPLVGDV